MTDYYAEITRPTAPPQGGRDYYSELTAAPATEAAPQRAAAPVEQPASSIGRAARFVDNVVRQAAQGATFGYMDEIAAGARTGAGLWGDYGAALAEERGRDAGFRAESPVTATVANIAGGVASPASRLRIFSPGRSASLPGAVIRGAGAGAAAGAAAGFGEGEGGVMPRAESALMGGAVGLAVGGALPVAIEGLRNAGGAVARRAGLSSGAPDAERIVLRDLARDGVTPDEVLRRSREAGAAPVAIADLGGENVTGAAAAIARTPGAGREAAARLVAERGGVAQADRLAGRVREFVSAQNFRESADALIADRATRAAPAYERAWRIQLRPDEFDRVAPMVNDRIGQDAMQRGLRVIELESLAARQPFDPAQYGVVRGANGWVPAEGQTPNMRLMDAVKRGYDAIVEDFRDPFGRLRLNEYGRAVNAVRAEYRNTLADMFPPYRRALEAWSGPSATLEAMTVGRRLLNDGPEAAEMTAAQIRRMAPGDREAFRIGVARGLMDRAERATDAQELTRLNGMFGSAAVRDRLRAAFDSDAEFGRFAHAMQRETAMARNNQALRPGAGSQTMPLTERAADLRNPPGSSAIIDRERQSALGPLVPDLVRAGTGGGITAPAFRMLERLQAGANQSRYEHNSNALAGMLFNPDPRAREEVARALMARELADRRTQRVISPAIRGLSRGAAVGGAIEVND